MLENKKGVDFSVSDSFLADEELKDIVLGDYSDSFYFFLNLLIYDNSIESFDWLDNPYIAANAYRLSPETNHQPELLPDVKLVACKKEELVKLVGEQWVDTYYRYSLCFDDLSSISLSKNFFAADYESMFISIDYCNNKTYNGICKTHQEIA